MPVTQPVDTSGSSEQVLSRLRDATRHGGAADIGERLAAVQEWLGTDIVALEQAIRDIEADLVAPLDNGLVDRALSTSYVATWSAERQAEVAREIRLLVAGFPALIRLPYVTDLYWCTKPS